MNTYPNAAEIIGKSSIITIKIGSDLIVENGQCRHKWMKSLAQDIKDFVKNENKKIIVVSSGAIALGRHRFSGIDKLSLPQKQAAAAYGQPLLMNAWIKAFRQPWWKKALSTAFNQPCYDLAVAQHLLTRTGLSMSERRENARNAIESVWKSGGIPIINENDTVATEEITFGDNDQLAVQVDELVSAKTTIFLSRGIDGLYRGWRTAAQELVRHIPYVTTEIEALADDTKSKNGTGGGNSKIKAGKTALEQNGVLIIARGEVMNPLRRLRQPDALCTCFAPTATYRTQPQVLTLAAS